MAIGESQKGLWRQAIRVKPENSSHKLDATSRLNYAKIFTIEHNVKVWFIGKVVESYIDHLMWHYNDVNPPMSISQGFVPPTDHRALSHMDGHRNYSSVESRIPEEQSEDLQNTSLTQSYPTILPNPYPMQYSLNPHGEGPSGSYNTYSQSQQNNQFQGQTFAGTTGVFPNPQYSTSHQQGYPAGSSGTNYNSQYSDQNYGQGAPGAGSIVYSTYGTPQSGHGYDQYNQHNYPQ
jgi:hypothetical protein